MKRDSMEEEMSIGEEEKEISRVEASVKMKKKWSNFVTVDSLVYLVEAHELFLLLFKPSFLWLGEFF